MKQMAPIWKLRGKVSQGPLDTLGVLHYTISSNSDGKVDLGETTFSDETILKLCTMRDYASRTFWNRWKSNEIENTISHSILFVLLGRLTISTPINHFTRALTVTIISLLAYHGLPCTDCEAEPTIAKCKTDYICLPQPQS